MPGVRRCRHWRDGERRSAAVGLDQFALVGHLLGGRGRAVRLRCRRRDRGPCRTSQRRLEGGDAVELDPRQAADEARSVVALDEQRVYVPGFWRGTQGWVVGQ